MPSGAFIKGRYGYCGLQIDRRATFRKICSATTGRSHHLCDWSAITKVSATRSGRPSNQEDGRTAPGANQIWDAHCCLHPAFEFKVPLSRKRQVVQRIAHVLPCNAGREICRDDVRRPCDICCIIAMDLIWYNADSRWWPRRSTQSEVMNHYLHVVGCNSCAVAGI